MTTSAAQIIRRRTVIWLIKWEGSCFGLIWDTIPGYAYRDWRKLRSSSVRIACLRTQIWPQDLPNTRTPPDSDIHSVASKMGCIYWRDSNEDSKWKLSTSKTAHTPFFFISDSGVQNVLSPPFPPKAPTLPALYERDTSQCGQRGSKCPDATFPMHNKIFLPLWYFFNHSVPICVNYVGTSMAQPTLLPVRIFTETRILLKVFIHNAQVAPNPGPHLTTR
jgi:hypothetical protein